MYKNHFICYHLSSKKFKIFQDIQDISRHLLSKIIYLINVESLEFCRNIFTNSHGNIHTSHNTYTRSFHNEHDSYDRVHYTAYHCYICIRIASTSSAYAVCK